VTCIWAIGPLPVSGDETCVRMIVCFQNVSYTTLLGLFSIEMRRFWMNGVWLLLVGQCTKSECNSKTSIDLTCPSTRPNAAITINTIALALQRRSGRPCTEECCSPVSNVTEDCFIFLPTTHKYHRNATDACNSKRQCQFNTFSHQQAYCNITRPNHYILVYYTCNSQLTSSTTRATTTTTTTTTTISKNTFSSNCNS